MCDSNGWAGQRFQGWAAGRWPIEQRGRVEGAWPAREGLVDGNYGLSPQALLLSVLFVGLEVHGVPTAL
jgi:hypothetical protein